jgi:hypothetical protein
VAEIAIRYAQTDNDIINIHRFLCLIAGPSLPGQIDPRDSIHEVWRVVTDDVALIAMDGEDMVGTMGLIRPKHWWGKVWFLANRWAFAIPGSGAWRPLLKEAKAIAVASELEFHLISEERGKVTILNRSPLRNQPLLAKSPNSSPALEM